MTGGFNKLLELGVGDRIAIHPKPIDPNSMSWGFLLIVVVRAHQESTARNPDHIFGWGTIRGGEGGP
jgi:hypothetical protein